MKKKTIKESLAEALAANAVLQLRIDKLNEAAAVDAREIMRQQADLLRQHEMISKLIGERDTAERALNTFRDMIGGLGSSTNAEVASIMRAAQALVCEVAEDHSSAVMRRRILAYARGLRLMFKKDL